MVVTPVATQLVVVATPAPKLVPKLTAHVPKRSPVTVDPVLLTLTLSRVKSPVEEAVEKMELPVTFKVPLTVALPVKAIVPSVALVIVSPFKRVREVVDATPPSWITPSVAFDIVSAF